MHVPVVLRLKISTFTKISAPYNIQNLSALLMNYRANHLEGTISVCFKSCNLLTKYEVL